MSPGTRSAIASLGLSLVLGYASSLLVQGSPARKAEWTSEDYRLRSIGRSPKAKIVLVKITSETRKSWREPTIFWGPRMAVVLDRLREGNVRWVGLDWLNTEAVDDFLKTQVPSAKSYESPYSEAIDRMKLKMTMPTYLLPESGTATVSIPAYHDSAEILGNVGAVNLDMAEDDQDGIKRRSVLEYRSGNFASPTLASAIAARLHGLEPTDEKTREQLAERVGLKDPNGPFLIHYNEKPFVTLDIQDLQTPGLSPEMQQTLKGAVVLIGADFPDDNDHWETPFGRMSGLEVHANILSTLLDGVPIEPSPPNRSALVAGILSAVLAAGALFLAPVGSSLVAALLLGGWWTYSIFMLRSSLEMTPLGGPLACAVASFGVALGIRAGLEAGKRRQVEAVFGKHVSKEVREYLMSAQQNLDLGGAEFEGSILFVDVWNSVERGATRSPEALIAELNELFQAIVPCVTENRGLVNRFLGDGFLAVFGVPFPATDHADAAVRACVAIQEAVRIMTRRNAKDQLTVSCGVHSGTFVCGNVGSDSRAEFTVIGDVVNTAARIEAANRQLGTRILVSEQTFSQLTSRYESEIHVVDLKGKGETRLYTLRENSVLDNSFGRES